MVYVDNMEAPFRGMIMCHMVADTPEELLDMAKKIGMKPKWIQHPGTYKEHFDICLTKRKLAVKHGAKEITWREYGEMVNRRPGSPIKSLMEKWDKEDANRRP